MHSYHSFFWILPGENLHAVIFVLLGIIYIFVKYIKTLSIFNDALETVFLFFLLQYLYTKTGFNHFFPFDLVITAAVLYVFLRKLRKIKSSELFLAKGEWMVKVHVRMT